MTEPETGEYAEPFATVVEKAVQFGEERPPKQDPLFTSTNRDVAIDDGLILRHALSIVSEGAPRIAVLREFGFPRLLVVAAGDPDILNIGVPESTMREVLSDLAQKEAIEIRDERRRTRRPAAGTDELIRWNYNTKRLGSLDRFVTAIVARPPSTPIDPSAARRK